MYGGSGFGGGGGGGGAAAVAGVAAAVATGSTSPPAAGVAAAASAGVARPAASRRARDRASRCSGISVMPRPTLDGHDPSEPRRPNTNHVAARRAAGPLDDPISGAPRAQLSKKRRGRQRRTSS